MRPKLSAVAPWALLAVVCFSGAGTGPKPVPDHIRLMLLEYQAQTDTLYKMRDEATLYAVDARINDLMTRHEVMLMTAMSTSGEMREETLDRCDSVMAVANKLQKGRESLFATMKSAGINVESQREGLLQLRERVLHPAGL